MTSTLAAPVLVRPTDPSAPPRTPAPASGRGRPDATTLLTAFTAVLVAVPSDLRVSGLGGAGAPVTLAALGVLLAWALFRLQLRTPLAVSSRAPRILLWVLLAATLGSWVQAMLRPVPLAEVSPANLGMLRMGAFVGVVLLASDGVTTVDRLLTLLRRVVLAGAALAGVGLAQFVTGRALVDAIVIPGTTSAQDFAAVVGRGDFTRSAGTATSPLEYAYVLALVFPLALAFAFFDRSRSVVRRSLPAVVMGAALLVSVSRSGLVGLVLVCVVMFPTWPAPVRRRMLAVGAVALVAVYVLVPGMAGTMRYLFTAGDSDPSAASRSGGLEVVAQYLPGVPVLGRGFGTFLPTYRIFDDQYLGLLVELGVLGVLAFVGLLATSAISTHLVARAVLRRAPDDPEAQLLAQLGHALVAATLAAAALTALFDMFAFPMAAAALALVLGLGGAHRRLAPR